MLFVCRLGEINSCPSQSAFDINPSDGFITNNKNYFFFLSKANKQHSSAASAFIHCRLGTVAKWRNPKAGK